MSNDDKGFIAMIKDQNLATIIIVAGFSLAGLLSGGLILVAYFAIGNTDITISRARDILLVVIPVQTLVIGSVFGFLAGRRTMTSNHTTMGVNNR